MQDEKRIHDLERLEKEADRRKKLYDEATAAYEAYRRTPDKPHLKKLIDSLDRLCRPWVQNKLSICGCLMQGIEDDALQDARLAVWQRLEASSAEDNFVSVSYNIYKFKSLFKK